MDLPRIGVKLSGDDGSESTKWEDSFVLDYSKILDTEAMHRRAQVRSLISMLYAWDDCLEGIVKRVTAQAVSRRAEEERIGAR